MSGATRTAPILGIDSKVWHATDHGVIGDGVTDDTQNIKNLLNAAFAAGAEVHFPYRDYKSSWFYVNSTPRITASEGARILMSNTNDAWNFGATAVLGTKTLTADAAAGTYVLQMASTAGIAADDVVQVGDTATLVGWNTSSNTLSTAALNSYRVRSVDSATQITLIDPLIYAMTVANGAFLNTLDMKRRAYIQDLHFESTAGQGTGVTASFLHLWYCRDVDVAVTAAGFSNAGLILDHCVDFRVDARVEKFADVAVTGIAGQFGYGVDVSGASAHGRVTLLADQCRHALSFAGTGHDVKVFGVASGCTSGAWDAHAGFTDVDFDVKAFGGFNSTGGVNLRGRRQRLVAGQLENIPGHAVSIFDNPQDVTVKATIRNCGGAGVHVAALNTTVSGLDIDVDVQGAGGTGVEFLSGGTYSDVRVTAKARNVHGPAIDIQRSITRGRIKLLVEDNQGTPTTTAGVNVTVAAVDVTVDIEAHNSIPITSGTQSGSLTLIGASTVFTPVLTTYNTAGTFSYSVPAGATELVVTLLGSGGGGGSGRVSASGTAAFGGGGGGGGSYNQARFPVSAITSPVSVTVGTGGTGGAAQATDSSSGNNGGGGVLTNFGSYLIAFGGNGGTGGSTTAGVAGTGGSGLAPGGAGANGVAGTGNSANFGTASGGGGGGGGLATTPVASNGGAGVKSPMHNQGTPGTGGTAPGGAGGTGVAPTTPAEPGVSAGGGASATTGAGGAGGTAASAGGGGGGGGAALNAQGGSGKGGDGGPGYAQILAR